MRLAIATVSLGRASAGHSLENKLRAASQAGIEGIEIFWECFIAYVNQSAGPGSQVDRWLSSARQLRILCDSLNLEIIALQPFVDFDGLVDPTSRLEDAKIWLQLMKIMGAGQLQVPANFAEITDSRYANTDENNGNAVIVRNLQMLSDLVADNANGVVIAYEPMAWSTFVDTWSHGLSIIRAVNRPDVRFCLDTFHIAGREYGDPTSNDGCIDNSASFEDSVKRLAAELKESDIGYVQLSDATLMSPPLPQNKLADPSQRPRMNWSRTSRTLPYMDGYLPLGGIIEAILQTGFNGWLSMESFNVSLFDEDQTLPLREAERAVESFKRVKEKHQI